MPRLARLDVPGALHHVIGRGIERRSIVRDDADRAVFVEHLGRVLTATGQAAGTGAAMAIRSRTRPRDIRVSELQRTLRDQGMILRQDEGPA